MKIFYFENREYPSPEEAVFSDAIYYDRWFSGECRYGGVTASPSLTELPPLVATHGIENVIPVGSAEFVERFCKKLGIAAPKPLNIPVELNDIQYTGCRRVYRQLLAEDVLHLPADHSYIIKPAEHMKEFDAVKYTPREELPEVLRGRETERIFVSELLSDEICSEWRIFVKRGDIICICPYGPLTCWEFPNKALCEEMAQKLAAYPAITLDIAVLSTGETVVIEVHHFISCGLYGFEGLEVLQMAALAWKYHVGQQIPR